MALTEAPRRTREVLTEELLLQGANQLRREKLERKDGRALGMIWASSIFSFVTFISGFIAGASYKHDADYFSTKEFNTALRGLQQGENFVRDPHFTLRVPLKGGLDEVIHGDDPAAAQKILDHTTSQDDEVERILRRTEAHLRELETPASRAATINRSQSEVADLKQSAIDQNEARKDKHANRSIASGLGFIGGIAGVIGSNIRRGKIRTKLNTLRR